ncbi:MAG TPA: PadR family transcriptional regulator [Longimicrobiales bacterium]|nr:PadR family transcriptional regulator [Longimicrobiales bacterium]
MNKRTDVLKGTLDLLILHALRPGPQHGYGITQWIRGTTGDVLQIDDGALYPALHRLEDRGWILADWGVSDNNRRAKFYRLSAEGSRRLQSETLTWERFARAVTDVIRASESAS